MVNLRWYFQKKLDNGQELTFTSDMNPYLCFAKTAVEIRGRIIRAKLELINPITGFLQRD